MTRLQERYEKAIPGLKSQFGYKNTMEVPPFGQGRYQYGRGRYHPGRQGNRRGGRGSDANRRAKTGGHQGKVNCRIQSRAVDAGRLQK